FQDMSIHQVLIINRAGSLIYDYEIKGEQREVERTFEYPLSVVLEEIDQKATVVFGEKDAIRLRYHVSAVNSCPVSGTRFTQEGQQENVLEFIENERNFPMNITFSPPWMSTNEKIILSSMFNSFFAIAVQLSPVAKSSGIEVLETSQFRLCCLQSRTGVKFVLVMSAGSTAPVDSILMKLYELYSDYALKNPFYTIDMPIRCHKFDEGLKALLERTDKSSGMMAV
ncbi:trpp-4, partial [Pristionchus pacificus]